MLSQPANKDIAPVDAAIAQVLQSEQAARDAVARCAAQADSWVAQARDAARQTAERAAARIAHVHAFAQVHLDARLAELDEARLALEQDATAAPPDDTRLHAAVATLAQELTSETP
jgi:hypothetical protein